MQPPAMPPPVAPRQPRSAASTILIILLGFAMLGAGSCVACIMWLGSGPEGGVLLANQVQPYTLAYLKEHNLLNETEKLIAYYDVTLELDGSESAILTSERLLYDVQGRTTSIPLSEIDDVETRDEGLTGDVIEVHSTGDEQIRIEIAPLNNGSLFIRELNRAVERTRSRRLPAEAPH